MIIANQLSGGTGYGGNFSNLGIRWNLLLTLGQITCWGALHVFSDSWIPDTRYIVRSSHPLKTLHSCATKKKGNHWSPSWEGATYMVWSPHGLAGKPASFGGRPGWRLVNKAACYDVLRCDASSNKIGDGTTSGRPFQGFRVRTKILKGSRCRL